MTTITRDSDSASSEPVLVLGYTARRESGTVVHELIDGSIAIRLVPGRPRSGTIEYLYSDEAAAWAALALHADLADTYTLADTTRAEVGMVYAALATEIRLDEETRDVWVVAVDYQEVQP